ncbi:MAG TPA: tetratricopeptide repeat protein [Gemmatimonadota bacterium]|nr:tetratricopeptide repeat protein [Gemmatimonadota bacterium]
MRIGPGLLVVVSFVTLSLGFIAGVYVGREESPEGPVAAPHPVGAGDHVRLGMQSLAAGDMAEAERHFREAVSLQPSEPGPRVDLAVALMSQGRWEEAERELSEAKRMAPELPAVWFLEGWVARDGLADTLRARGAWRRYLELVPADAPQAAEVRQWLGDSAASGG